MMEHNNVNIPKEVTRLIGKLLSGIPLGAEELDHLNQWYDECYDSEWETADQDLGPDMLKRIHDKIDKGNGGRVSSDATYPRTVSAHKRFTGYKTQIWLRAAVVTFLLMATVLTIYVSQYGKQEVPQTVAAWTTYQNPAGQKSKVRLPDGSVVYVNAATEIKYQDGFGETHRELFLNGESYFEVAKDSLPFRVHSAGLVTQALGTSFNISTFDAASIRVQLASGIVKVYHAFKDQPSVQIGRAHV